MKKFTKMCILIMIIVSFAFTCPIAAETAGSAGKVKTDQVETKKKTQNQKRKAINHRDPSQQASRMASRQEKDKIIRKFMDDLRNAERKYKKDKSSASKLKGDEKKAAMKKASADMDAAIKKAEEDRDAALMVLEPEKMKERKRKEKKRAERKKQRDAERKKEKETAEQQKNSKKSRN